MQSFIPVALFFAFAAIAVLIWIFSQKQGFKLLGSISMTIAFIFSLAYGERFGIIHQRLMWLLGYESQFADSSSWGPVLIAIVISILVAFTLRLIVGYMSKIYSKTTRLPGQVSPYLSSLVAILIILYATAWGGSYLSYNKHMTPGTTFASLVTAGFIQTLNVAEDMLKEMETETNSSSKP